MTNGHGGLNGLSQKGFGVSGDLVLNLYVCVCVHYQRHSKGHFHLVVANKWVMHSLFYYF